jgi:antitoxin (DNA-binding transcriptional repressor) of toxin-antitoxin stability system
MKTLTVQEASQSLSDWLRRAAGGEQIAIHEGDCTVLLQPLTESREASVTKGPSARDALRQLQSRSRLTAAQVEDYLREVRAERLTDGARNGQ